MKMVESEMRESTPIRSIASSCAWNVPSRLVVYPCGSVKGIFGIRWCTDAVEHATAGLPLQHRLDGISFAISEFVAQDSNLPFGSLNHRPLANFNAPACRPSASGAVSG